MFRMLEVVGVSEAGFSEAVVDAVKRLSRAGHEVHFFDVVSLRGSVRDGKTAEFQVTLKAAIKDKDL